MKKLCLTAVAALALTACSDSETEKLRIGGITSLTGGYGSPDRLQGAVLAVDEINAAGGVLGKQLEIDSRDDSTEPTNARSIAEELVASGVPAIIGAAASGSTVAMSEVTIPAQVVTISGSSTSPRISGLDDGGFVNRTCSSDALQGKLIAQRARARGLNKMAVIYAPNPYGEGLTAAFVESFQALGGTVTAQVVAESAQTDYTSTLTAAYVGDPEGLLIVLYAIEGAEVMKDYLESFSARGTFFYFPDSLAEAGFVTLLGADKFTFGHEGTGPAVPVGERYQRFANDYSAKFGGAPGSTSFAANFYDAVYLVALAIEAGGKAEGPSIRDQLANVSKGGTAYGPESFKDAAAAAKAGTDINFEGASGAVDLNEFGEPIAPYDLWTVSNGAITVFEGSVSP